MPLLWGPAIALQREKSEGILLVTNLFFLNEILPILKSTILDQGKTKAQKIRISEVER